MSCFSLPIWWPLGFCQSASEKVSVAVFLPAYVLCLMSDLCCCLVLGSRAVASVMITATMCAIIVLLQERQVIAIRPCVTKMQQLLGQGTWSEWGLHKVGRTPPLQNRLWTCVHAWDLSEVLNQQVSGKHVPPEQVRILGAVLVSPSDQMHRLIFSANVPPLLQVFYSFWFFLNTP